MEPTICYDIKDAARYLDVAPSTLRYWESAGLLRPERNAANDYRRYSVRELIDAGEVAFYRKLGVSVKDLKAYRDLTVKEIDGILDRTAEDIECRIADLESMREQIERQRQLNACTEELLPDTMRHAMAGIERMAALDYSQADIWQVLVREPWRYGVLIEAAHPEAIVETVVDTPVGSGQALWKREDLAPGSQCLECLLRVDVEGDGSTARQLFSRAKAQGLDPIALVGSYLLTALEESGGKRWDFYHAWIIG